MKLLIIFSIFLIPIRILEKSSIRTISYSYNNFEGNNTNGGVIDTGVITIRI